MKHNLLYTGLGTMMALFLPQQTVAKPTCQNRAEIISFHLENTETDKYNQALNGYISADNLLFKQNKAVAILAYKQAEFNGNDIVSFELTPQKRTSPELENTVSITFTPKAAEKFKQITQNNIGKRIAIVQNKNKQRTLLYAPTIMEGISGSKAVFSGKVPETDLKKIAQIFEKTKQCIDY